ncbi:sporulation protein [Paenibacillus sp. 1011MAR3C5]|uniref:putative sporulation protein YtxC n=1 Tax=Paenibacillus sp. 1011MAR3C5 TaxID=1675787 RepID=UPI000E6CCEA9|nr:putative sporulation protein YtxC [Paenibacillus sp. 1011MAR3C5]RJE88992.1 sporulation protein [Paenibacillus sp. 1011MAR3C5]
MDLFRIALPDEESVESLQSLLKEQVNADLHRSARKEGLLLVQFVNEKGAVRCVAQLPQFQLKTEGPLLYKSTASAVAEYVVSHMESDLLSAIIRKKYRGHPSMDTVIIEKYCQDLLHGKEWEGLGSRFQEADRSRRKGKIADEIEKFLEVETELNLYGLLTFRLHTYRKELTEIVEYALDEYVLDKQYQEFISLLKYFVQLQESKVPLVHLVHKGGHDFMLYNDNFQTLEPKPPSDRIVAEMLETEMNIEDMVISSLISVSPKQIMIHTRHPDMQVIRTIQTIFDSRVKVCVKCPSCSSTLDELIHP